MILCTADESKPAKRRKRLTSNEKHADALVKAATTLPEIAHSNMSARTYHLSNSSDIGNDKVGSSSAPQHHIIKHEDTAFSTENPSPFDNQGRTDISIGTFVYHRESPNGPIGTVMEVDAERRLVVVAWSTGSQIIYNINDVITAVPATKPPTTVPHVATLPISQSQLAYPNNNNMAFKEEKGGLTNQNVSFSTDDPFVADMRGLGCFMSNSDFHNNTWSSGPMVTDSFETQNHTGTTSRNHFSGDNHGIHLDFSNSLLSEPSASLFQQQPQFFSDGNLTEQQEEAYQRVLPSNQPVELVSGPEPYGNFNTQSTINETLQHSIAQQPSPQHQIYHQQHQQHQYFYPSFGEAMHDQSSHIFEELGLDDTFIPAYDDMPAQFFPRMETHEDTSYMMRDFETDTNNVL